MSDESAGEVERLRAEREALTHEVERLQGRKHRRGRVRGILAVIGIVLSCVLLLATVLGVWARRSFLKTDVFAARAGNLIEDVGVRDALSFYLTEQINKLIDPESIFDEALPERAQILAAPLAGAVRGFISDKVDEFVDSEGFRELWKSAVETAHREVIRVLEGDTPLVHEDEDKIVINLIPIINEGLARIGEASPEIFGRTVNLPTITVDEVPERAREAIANALGVDVDDDFGTFTIYDDGALTAAQEAVSLTDRLVWVFVVLTPLAIVGTLWVSRRRRRTLLQLSVGIALTMVLLRRLVFIFQDDLIALVRIQRNVPAVEATSDAFLGPLLDAALWIGLLALAIAVVAAVSGPYAWAVRGRERTVSAARGLTAAVSERSQDEATVAWVAAHLDLLRLAGVVVGLVLLWWIELSWFGFFLLVGLVAAYELALQRLAERGAPPAEEDEDTPAASAGVDATS